MYSRHSPQQQPQQFYTRVAPVSLAGSGTPPQPPMQLVLQPGIQYSFTQQYLPPRSAPALQESSQYTRPPATSLPPRAPHHSSPPPAVLGTPRRAGGSNSSRTTDYGTPQRKDSLTSSPSQRTSPGVRVESGEETDQHRLKQRMKQIAFGKVTLGYKNYAFAVPKWERQQDNDNHPCTPRKTVQCSKRKWDNMVAAWRRALHSWDANPPPHKMALRSARTLGELGVEPFTSLEEHVAAVRKELEVVQTFVQSLKGTSDDDEDSGPEATPNPSSALLAPKVASAIPPPLPAIDAPLERPMSGLDIERFLVSDADKRDMLKRVLEARISLGANDSISPLRDSAKLSEDDDVAREIENNTPTRNILVACAAQLKRGELIFAANENVLCETPLFRQNAPFTPTSFFKGTPPMDGP